MSPRTGPVRGLVLALVLLSAGGLAMGAAWWVVATVPPLTEPVRTAAGDLASVVAGDDAATGPAPVVAVVGDGVTAGVPAEDGDRPPSWPALICARLGCALTSYAAPGTGWATAGSSGQTVAGSLDDVVAADPDVVVIAAGSSDVAAGRPRVRGSVNQVLYRLERRLPGVPVLVLTPFAVTSPAPGEITAVGSWVAEGAAKHDATLVDVTDVLGAAGAGAVDAGGRPTGRGQEAVADAVAPWVEDALD